MRLQKNIKLQNIINFKNILYVSLEALTLSVPCYFVYLLDTLQFKMLQDFLI